MAALISVVSYSSCFGGTSNITAVWANEGGDKVAQEELRASNGTENLTGKVLNRAWNGRTILLAGARNEVVSFNLILEAARANAANVSVTFNSLVGPNGAVISSTPTSGDGVFNWVGRPIELFFVRYLMIRGLSFFGYGRWDERQIPLRFQRPYVGNGDGRGVWTDRPDHDKSYPDILVPLELTPNFNINAGKNQGIWGDIYIPKGTPAGLYQGNILVREQGTVTRTIPLQLLVYNFQLLDTPSAKTMVYLDTTDIEWRYITGYGGYANWNTPDGRLIQQITDKYYQLFHRHRISLIGENECPTSDAPCDSSLPRVDGSLFTPTRGYDGPGVGTSTGIFAVGPYSTWGNGTYGIAPWKHDQNLFRQHTNNWMNWFSSHLPSVEVFLYLMDEPGTSDFGQVEQWSSWMANNPGPGHSMLSMSTVDFNSARANIPDLQIPVTHATLGFCLSYPCNNVVDTKSIVARYQVPGRRLWMYNDGRPATGTFDTEDDGVSPRVIGWQQFKLKIDRWFYWYANLNNPLDWFAQATTWGTDSYFSVFYGWTGDDYKTNGNGLLVYPGTDKYHSVDSYNVHGPFASIRLKAWRRGIQDSDYLVLASRVNPQATQAIVQRIVPNAEWEYQASDPNFYFGPISWSVDPDVWEQARIQLAQIIVGGCSASTVASCT